MVDEAIPTQVDDEEEEDTAAPAAVPAAPTATDTTNEEEQPSEAAPGGQPSAIPAGPPADDTEQPGPTGTAPPEEPRERRKKKPKIGLDFLTETVLDFGRHVHGLISSVMDGPPKGAIPTGQEETEEDAQKLAAERVGGRARKTMEDRPNQETGRGMISNAWEEFKNPTEPTPSPSPDPRKMKDYLSGMGRVSPETAEGIIHAVDPDGSSPNPEQKALEHANRKSGLGAAHALMQHFRSQYDATKTAAGAALNSDNLTSSFEGANLAFNKLPDGEHVSFTPGANGMINATVIDPAGASRTFSLSTDQYRDLLLGKSGQFDKVLETGLADTLGQLMTTGRPASAAPAKPASVAPAERPGMTKEVQYTSDGKPISVYKGRPGSSEPGGGQAQRTGSGFVVPDYLKNQGITQDEYDTARIRYPGASQGPQRIDWLMGRKNTRDTDANKLDIAKTTAQGRVEAKKEEAEGRKGAADIRGQHGENMMNIRGGWQNKTLNETTKAKLLAATEQLMHKQEGAEARTRAYRARTIVQAVEKGVSLDELDAKLKASGESIRSLLTGERETEAPQKPKGQTIRDDKTKTIYEIED